MTADLEQLRRYHEQGDASAFTHLVRMHASMVFATAQRITRDASLAEDVAQETFLELARQGRSITDSLSAWLYRVAHRRACDAVRTNVRRRHHEATLPEEWPHEPQATWHELEPMLDEALLELPASQSTLIVEHFLQGRTQTDIARSMGLSQSSVSRQINEAIEGLRSRLKAKGVICGSGLGAMLAAHSAQAAPAALVAALCKIGITGLGSGAAVGASATLAPLLAVKVKLALGLAAVLLVSTVGYDLSLRDSHLQHWFARVGAASTPEQMPPATRTPQPPRGEHELSEAKEIWKKAVKIDSTKLSKALERCRAETNIDKQIAILHSVGIMISKSAFQQVLARPHKAARDSISGEYEYKWLIATLMAWAQESPWEAIAHGNNIERLMWAARGSLSLDAKGWDAFVQACPDPRTAAQLKYWITEIKNPGTAWTEALKAGVTTQQLADRLTSRVYYDLPETALKALRACPQASIRRDAIFALAPRLSSEQLLQVAAADFAGSEPVANYLRVLAGDPTASFAKAIEGAYSLDATPRLQLPDELDSRNVNLRCLAERDIYRRWIATAPAAALAHAARDFKSWGSDLDSFMFEALRAGSVDETMISDVLATAPEDRDRALTSWYEAHAPGDPVTALEQIIHSTTIEDQVKAATVVLRKWVYLAPLEAAAWLKSQPAIKQRGELAAIIARGWMVREPELALAFAREQGVNLAARYAHGMVIDYLRHASRETGDRLLLSLRDEEEYNPLIINAGGNRFRHQPDDGLNFIASHVNGDWQQALVDEFESFIVYNFFHKTAPYAQALSSLELSRLDHESVLKAASMVMRDFNRGNELRNGLDWTLKLPSDIATITRESFVGGGEISTASRQATLMAWIQTAAITSEERTRLQTALNERP